MFDILGLGKVDRAVYVHVGVAELLTIASRPTNSRLGMSSKEGGGGPDLMCFSWQLRFGCAIGFGDGDHPVIISGLAMQGKVVNLKLTLVGWILDT